MTDRITSNKQQKVNETLKQLNREISPLVVKAIIIDPMMLKAPMTDATRVRVLDDIIKYIHSIASMVVE